VSDDGIGTWRKAWGPRPEKVDRDAPPVSTGGDGGQRPGAGQEVVCRTRGCLGHDRRWTVTGVRGSNFKCALCGRRMRWAGEYDEEEAADAQQTG
jgi:hypothetical protein